MSKFQPLSERLAGHPGEEWRASIAEIEEMLGFPLPKAARGGAAWWDRQGFTAKADAKSGQVTFRRGDISPAAMQAVLDPPEPGPQPELQSSAIQVPGEPERIAPTAKGWGVMAAVGGLALLVGAGIAALRWRRA